MANKRIIQQVRGILVEEGVEYAELEPGPRFKVPVPDGSAEVLIGFDDWHDGTVVSMSAEVLRDLELPAERRLELLEALNEINRQLYFVKAYYDEPTAAIKLEYDQIGDELEGEELMNALYEVGIKADEYDDLMRERFGGRRAVDGDA